MPSCREAFDEFSVLTLIIIIVVIFTAADLASALLLIGLVVAFRLMLLMCGHRQRPQPKETMQPKPQKTARIERPKYTPSYPGAIDFCDDTDPSLGHADWDTRARGNAPEGDPRIAGLQAAPPCVDGDSFASYDGDELVTYHARSRNDPERVWAGARHRKTLVDKYVREELDERENIRWWGVHET
jgi:hypothetical protein